MLNNILEEIGLSENEVVIYNLLVKKGPSLANTISEFTKINRAYVYDILDNLVKKGLVSYVLKDNKKYFKPANANKLLDLFREKQKIIESQKIKLISYISEVKKIKTEEEKGLNASIYQGKEGVKTVLNEVLETGKDYLNIGYAEGSERLLPYFLENFHKQRVKKKIKRKILLNINLRESWNSKLPLQEVRYLPKDYGSLMGQLIYGNKVAIFIVNEEDFVSLVIENKGINESFKKQFSLLWNLAKK